MASGPSTTTTTTTTTHTARPAAQVLDDFNAWAPWTLDDKFAMVECFYGWGSISVKIVYHGPKADVEAAVANATLFSNASGSGTPAELTWTDFLVQVGGQGETGAGRGGSSAGRLLATPRAQPPAALEPAPCSQPPARPLTH